MSISEIILIALFFLTGGSALLILRHYWPESTAEVETAQQVDESTQRLSDKGLPAQTASFWRRQVWPQLHKVWRIILEAKGFRHDAATEYRMKKMASEKPLGALSEDVPLVPSHRTEADYIELIRRNKNELSYYNELGQFYLENQQFPDAVDVFTYLTEHDATNAGYWAKLGFAKLSLGDFPSAREAYEESVRLEPSFPGRLYNLNLAFQGEHNYDGARQALLQALELEPSNEKYQQALFTLEAEIHQVRASQTEDTLV